VTKNIATGTLLAAAILCAALMIVSPAAAQQSQARTWCYGNSTDVETISGCTLVILSGRESQRNLASAYFNRGIAYKNKGDFDRAIADYTQAIQLNPKDAKPHVNRANAYSDKGDFDRAVADYNEAIQLDPKFAFAYLNRGLANLFTGALPKAIADLNQASELDPKFAYVALWLDIAARRSNLPSRLPEAIKQIDMTKWPAPVIRLYLGQLTPEAVLAAADDPDATKKKEQVCDANFFSGELALQRGAKDEATRLFRLAATGCPKNRDAYDSANAELKALGASP
jgi:lipoprotein NlpI